MTYGQLFIKMNPNVKIVENGTCIWIPFDTANNHYTFGKEWWDKEIPTSLIKEQESKEPVSVKHGEWKYSENVYDESTWICSVCKEPWTLIDGTPQENGMKYCPSCGAKMDEEKR